MKNINVKHTKNSIRKNSLFSAVFILLIFFSIQNCQGQDTLTCGDIHGNKKVQLVLKKNCLKSFEIDTVFRSFLLELLDKNIFKKKIVMQISEDGKITFPLNYLTGYNDIPNDNDKVRVERYFNHISSCIELFYVHYHVLEDNELVKYTFYSKDISNKNIQLMRVLISMESIIPPALPRKK